MVWVGLILIATGAYSVLAVTSMKNGTVKLNSPDETANYYFSKKLAQDGEIGYIEPLLQESQGILHPRSTMGIDRRVVPTGFLGMILLYGAMASVTGAGIILFLTPLFAALSSISFYVLLTRIFSQKVAMLSAVLLLIHPAYWYYASRGMFPNILFVDLLLLGFALILASLSSRDAMREISPSRWNVWEALRDAKVIYALCGGLCIGLALTVRLSEIVWVVGILALLLVFNIRSVGWVRPSLIGVVMALPIVGLLIVNQTTYAHAFAGGYPIPTPSIPALQPGSWQAALQGVAGPTWGGLVGEVVRGLHSLYSLFFPFGFHPRAFLQHGMSYGVMLMPWLALPALIGVVEVARRILTSRDSGEWKSHVIYLLVTLGVAGWLITLYGSWVFFDNPSRETTIGNAYVRYWLPIYILSIPYIAEGIAWIAKQVRVGAQSAVVVIIVGFLTSASFFSVWYVSEDGLMSVRDSISHYHEVVESVQMITPKDAVIISQRSDKLFFPERRVALWEDEFKELTVMAGFAKNHPVYYFGVWDQESARRNSERYFAPHDLKLQLIAEYAGNEALYRVETVK